MKIPTHSAMIATGTMKNWLTRTHEDAGACSGSSMIAPSIRSLSMMHTNYHKIPRTRHAWDTYASGIALRHLEALDEEFVGRALSLGVDSGLVLDVGTGPGQIPIKLALRNPSFIIHAIDISDAMLRKAALDAGQWGVDMRILLNRGDAKDIPYEPATFDLVLCNSVLHHASDPVRLI